MEPLMFVMAILGCGEGDAPCERIALASARYASLEACMAATEAELIRHGDRPWPVVVAQCRPEGEAARPLNAIEVARPEPQPLRRR